MGVRLGLKGTRCESPKCAVVRRPYKPGAHGNSKSRRRSSTSDFARQLLEKQKFKVTYGLHERTLRRMFETANKSESETSSKLLELFERRLDNMLYRAGLASSRADARQMVVQGHVMVNNRRTRSPSLSVKVNDVISLRDISREKNRFKSLKETLVNREIPEWLALDKDKLEVRVISLPVVSEPPFEINLLVESFSK